MERYGVGKTHRDSKLTPTKSSLVMRFVNNDFQENKEPTIGGTYTATCGDVAQQPPASLYCQTMTNALYDSRILDTEMQPTNPNHQV